MFPSTLQKGKYLFLLLAIGWTGLCGIAHAQLKQDSGVFRDEFRDLALVEEFSNLGQRRDFPRVVRRPDVRLDPTSPWSYVYKGEPYSWGWFPTITRLHNGELLCVYREGKAHVYTPAERTVAVISLDGGITWSRPIVVASLEGWAVGAHQVIQTHEGTVIVTGGAQKLVGKDVFDPRSWEDFSFIVRSKDNGRTWGPMERWDGPEGTSLYGVTELSNSELLWYGGVKTADGWIRATMIRREENGEAKWEVRPHPEISPTTADEWSVAETRVPGTLVCLCRNQQHGEYYGTSRSYDYGKTWEPWRYSNIWIGPRPTRPYLRRLENGMLVASYGERFNRRGFVVVSKDDGVTWDVEHKLSIIDSEEYCHISDTLYTDVAWAGGDRALVVNYVQTPKEQKQRGLYGTFVDLRYFSDQYRGLRLGQVGATVRKDTVGHWSFDEADGDTAYDSTGKNYARIYGAQRIPGRLGRALAFNGKDQYMMVKDTDNLRVPKWFALEAWIRPVKVAGKQLILSKGFKYGFGIEDGYLFLQWGPGVAKSKVAKATPGKWQHVAVSYAMRESYSRATFYVDGVEQDWVQPDKFPASPLEAQGVSDIRPVTLPTYEESRGPDNQSSDNLVMGMNNNLTQDGFAGDIDEVAIHAWGSSEEQIQASASRRFLPRGTVRSTILEKPSTARWGSFEAEVVQPEKTRVAFSLLDEKGKVLRASIQPGEDLSKIAESRICLKAEFQTDDSGQSPILKSWSASLKDGLGVRISPKQLPYESAPYQQMVKPGDEGKEPVY